MSFGFSKHGSTSYAENRKEKELRSARRKKWLFGKRSADQRPLSAGPAASPSTLNELQAQIQADNQSIRCKRWIAAILITAVVCSGLYWVLDTYVFQPLSYPETRP